MKKLSLNIDDLSVNTFRPSDASASAEGTVQGQAVCPTEFEEHCDDTVIDYQKAGSMDEIQCCTTPQECFSEGFDCYLQA